MSDELNTALTLMAIGMVTVFFVLAVVVNLGHFLIWLVNRFFPLDDPAISTNGGKIAPAKIAAITAAVETFTGGRGKIIKIEKH